MPLIHIRRHLPINGLQQRIPLRIQILMPLTNMLQFRRIQPIRHHPSVQSPILRRQRGRARRKSITKAKTISDIRFSRSFSRSANKQIRINSARSSSPAKPNLQIQQRRRHIRHQSRATNHSIRTSILRLIHAKIKMTLTTARITFNSLVTFISSIFPTSLTSINRQRTTNNPRCKKPTAIRYRRISSTITFTSSSTARI